LGPRRTWLPERYFLPALVRRSAEPFGVFAFRLTGGGLREKCLGIQHKLDEERVQLALCDGTCGS